MSDAPTGVRLYNTLTRSKEDFVPIDPNNVRMYVCGPTVYDFAHIGNARPVIVFDVLFRLLRHVYGAEHVIYVRNITDVDDKINARALRDFPELPLNEAIRRVTETTANQFHADVAALGCLPPTHEPRATDFVLPRADGKADMVTLIQRLIERGHAYEAEGEVLFDTRSMADYGALSKRNLDEQQAGARVAVDAHKKNPGDFVLWKQSSPDEPGWDAAFKLRDGRIASIRGRPGWHIECSAMSAAYLGEIFDIHGGGLDLIFPHHENEIAQSRCAHGTAVMANTWMHNGFLQVEGRKMSKSEGNFVTIRENLQGKFPGWNGGSWHGAVLRTAMLMTYYRQPIDWRLDRLLEASNKVSFWHLLISNWRDENWLKYQRHGFDWILASPYPEVLSALCDDLNTPAAISFLSEVAETSSFAVERLISSLIILGIVDHRFFKANVFLTSEVSSGGGNTDTFLLAHELATAIANFDDEQKAWIETQLERDGWKYKWLSPSHLDLSRQDDRSRLDIDSLVNARLVLIAEKNWTAADRIRDELLAQGIQLKDGKDADGNRITTWEVKR